MRARLSALCYHLSTVLTRALLFSFFRWQVHHAERVPATGPVVLVSNHLHVMDPPLVAASCRRRVHPMAKRELFETPLIGWFFWAYGAFPVRRFSADVGALRTARQHLRNNNLVLMFPEGTRSQPGPLQPALPGAAMVALLSNAPIVPVAITGTHRLSLTRSLIAWVRRARPQIEVTFGEPFYLEAGPANASRAEHATDLIMRRVAELLPEEQRGAYGPGTEGDVVVRRQGREDDGT